MGGQAHVDLPAVHSRGNFMLYTSGASGIQADPNASDNIELDGTLLDDGDKINNLTTAGNTAVFFSRQDGTGWVVSSDSWTDGGV